MTAGGAFLALVGLSVLTITPVVVFKEAKYVCTT
jgi:hypothetical protein